MTDRPILVFPRRIDVNAMEIYQPEVTTINGGTNSNYDWTLLIQLGFIAVLLSLLCLYCLVRGYGGRSGTSKAPQSDPEVPIREVLPETSRGTSRHPGAAYLPFGVFAVPIQVYQPNYRSHF